MLPLCFQLPHMPCWWAIPLWNVSWWGISKYSYAQHCAQFVCNLVFTIVCSWCRITPWSAQSLKLCRSQLGAWGIQVGVHCHHRWLHEVKTLLPITLKTVTLKTFCNTISSSASPGDEDWQAALPTRCYLYPVHVSGSFLLYPTLASLLWVIQLFFFTNIIDTFLLATWLACGFWSVIMFALLDASKGIQCSNVDAHFLKSYALYFVALTLICAWAMRKRSCWIHWKLVTTTSTQMLTLAGELRVSTSHDFVPCSLVTKQHFSGLIALHLGCFSQKRRNSVLALSFRSMC